MGPMQLRKYYGEENEGEADQIRGTDVLMDQHHGKQQAEQAFGA
jgi:hypothetical protein